MGRMFAADLLKVVQIVALKISKTINHGLEKTGDHRAAKENGRPGRGECATASSRVFAAASVSLLSREKQVPSLVLCLAPNGPQSGKSNSATEK